MDILLDHELTFGDLIDSLVEVARRPAMPVGELDWTQELVQAHGQLRLAIEARDAEPLQRAIRLTRARARPSPTRINERLNAAARALRLVAIERSMLSIRQDLRRLKLAPQQVRRFESGVTALGDLGKHLTGC